MREEVLVLRGDDRVANNGGNFLISCDLAGFRPHLLKWPAVGIVNSSDRRELKPGESFQIRQIVSIKVDVVETRSRHNGPYSRSANKNANQAVRPIKPPQPSPAHSPNRCPGAHPRTPEPGSNRHRRAQSRRRSRYAHG